MLMDDDGDEDYIAFAIDRDGTHFERLDRASEIIRRDRKNPRRVIVYSNPTVRNKPDPCWLDLKTGKITSLTKNPGNVDGWVLDRANVARIGFASSGLDQAILYRDRDGDPWRTLAVFKDGEPRWWPLQFDADNRTLYVKSNLGRKTYAIYRYDTATHQLGDLVRADDKYDVTDVIWSEARQRIVGVSYEADKPVVHWLDESFERRQKIIDEALASTVNRQLEATDDGSKIVVFARSDREPGVYYLFDEARRKIEELAVVRPNLDPEKMSPMRPVAYRARDGLLIHGYLTLPLGRDPKKLPLIVNPHGGPFGIRDTWGFNSEVQFLANRGYAVLQPNYRGSGGYGDEFERLGYRQWGRTMQDDLTDGVKWLEQEGVADPERVAIVGASYGGYAAMAGLTFTPELYCAAVNYVGVTDLMLLTKQRRVTDAHKLWTRTRIGDAFDDADELRARSPVFHVPQIRAPVLLAYGRTDPRVTREHGDDLRAALSRHGKDFVFVLEDDEGHGFRLEEKSIAFFTRVDAFLKKHLQNADVKVGPTKVIDMPAKKKP
jgi:dipeptidyl aminopeptidase/acylaminoacyl peptidase